MGRMTPDYLFRRCVIRAALRKDRDDLGMRHPDPRETPLSPSEIFHGAQHGIIRIPALDRTFSTRRTL